MSVEIFGGVQGPELEDTQAVLDVTPLGKRNATRELNFFESETLDNTIASFFYEKALSFNSLFIVQSTAMRDPRL
jgi:hypothetical protein